MKNEVKHVMDLNEWALMELEQTQRHMQKFESRLGSLRLAVFGEKVIGEDGIMYIDHANKYQRIFI